MQSNQFDTCTFSCTLSSDLGSKKKKGFSTGDLDKQKTQKDIKSNTATHVDLSVFDSQRT